MCFSTLQSLSGREVFIPLQAQHNPHCLTDGKISVCMAAFCVLCLQPRKWTDLQSAKGRIDRVHTCDDVKMKGREMALTKSRATMAQCKSEVNGEMELSPTSCTWLDCVKCLSLAAGQCSRPAPSLSSVLVLLAAACERYIELSLLYNRALYWKGRHHTPSTKRTWYATLFRCNKQAPVWVWET